MTDASARWRRVEELRDRALADDHIDREAFLSTAFGPDDEFRQEVVALLANEGKADEFLG